MASSLALMHLPQENDPIQHSANIHAALAAIRAQAQVNVKANQNKNTFSAYKKPLRLWYSFCSKYGFDDGVLVTDDKVLGYLEEVVFVMRVPPKKSKGTRIIKEKKPRGKGKKRQLEIEAPETTPSADDPEVLAMAIRRGIPQERISEMLNHDLFDDTGRDIATGPVDEDEDEVDVEGSQLCKSTVGNYMSALTGLFDIQVTQGYHKGLVTYRSLLVKDALRAYNKAQNQRNRDNFVDRGINGINSGYNEEDWMRIHIHLLQSAPTKRTSLRTRLDMLLGHYLVMRGESRRLAELCDFSLLTYPSSEGPTPCLALVQCISQSKTNKHGKKQYMGAIRHKDPLLCTMGAFAMYMFSRFHRDGEPAPSFKNRAAWYRTKCLVGKTGIKLGLSYVAQYECSSDVFTALRIIVDKITHVHRAEGIKAAEMHGVPKEELSRAGLWDSSAMTNAYLSYLPKTFMKIVAGFPPAQGAYYLARAEHEPPESLKRSVFPWLEEWEDRLRERASGKKTFAQGGLDEDDLSAHGFIVLMKALRTVFLQDAACFQKDFPDLPIYEDPLFRLDAWAPYRSCVEKAVVERSEPRSLLLERAVPEICTTMNTNTAAILQSTSKLVRRFDTLEATVNAMANGTIRFTGDLQFNTARQVVHQSAAFPPAASFSTPSTPQRPALPANPQHLAIEASPQHLAIEASPQALTPRQSSTQPAVQADAQLVVRERPYDFTVAAVQPPRKRQKPVAPEYKQLDCKTMQECWREYTHGIGADYQGMPRPSVRWLEKIYGAAWRPGQPARSWFCRRKKFYNLVAKRTVGGVSEESVVAVLENYRHTNGKTVNGVCADIEKGRLK